MKIKPQTTLIVNTIRERYGKFQADKCFNPYYMLGFDKEDASLKEIQKRFRAIAPYFHEDRQPSEVEKEIWLFLGNVKELLYVVAKDTGRNVAWKPYFMSHDCRFTDKISMRCAVLHQGRLMAVGPSLASFSKPPASSIMKFETLCKRLKSNPKAFCDMLSKRENYKILRAVTSYEQLFTLLNIVRRHSSSLHFILNHFCSYSYKLEGDASACFLSSQYSLTLKKNILAFLGRSYLDEADIGTIIAESLDGELIDAVLRYCLYEKHPGLDTPQFKDYWHRARAEKPVAFDLLCQNRDDSERINQFVIRYFMVRGSRVLLDWLDYEKCYFNQVTGEFTKVALPDSVKRAIAETIINQEVVFTHYLREPRDGVILGPYLPVNKIASAFDKIKDGEWKDAIVRHDELLAERVSYEHHRPLHKAVLECALTDYLAKPLDVDFTLFGDDYPTQLIKNLAELLKQQQALLVQAEKLSNNEFMMPQARKAFHQLGALRNQVAKQEKVLEEALIRVKKRIEQRSFFDSNQRLEKKRVALQSALLGIQYTHYTLGEMTLNLTQPKEASPSLQAASLVEEMVSFQQHQIFFCQAMKRNASDKNVSAFDRPIHTAVGIVKDIVLLFTGLGTASILIRGLLSPITQDANWRMGAFSFMGSETKRLVASTNAKMVFFQKEMQKITDNQKDPLENIMSAERKSCYGQN